jgi:uncharacterized protein (UPF0305 family)
MTKKENIMTDIIDILEYMLNEARIVKAEYRDGYLQAIADLIEAYIQY